MHADEVRRPRHALGEPGHRQRRGVRRQQRPFGHVRLDLGVHLVLQGGVLEHCLDQEVGALGVGGVVGRGDPLENLVGRFLRHLAACDRLVQDLLAVVLALLGRLQRDILEHDLHAGSGRDVGDARAHHARAQHHELLGAVGLEALGPRATLGDVLQVEEERLRHVLGHLAGGQVDEVAGLDLVGGVEVHLGTFDGRGHDVVRCRHGRTLDLLAQVRGERREHGSELGVARGATGDLVALDVPLLGGLRIRLDPRLRVGDQVLGRRHELIDQTDLEGGRRLAPLALEQHLHECLLQAEHPDGAGDAATTRQQAQ